MNRETKALPLFFILAMLILATGFYSFSQAESKTFRKNTDLIWSINERASQLSLAILFVVEGVKKDYDHVSHVQQDLIKLTEQLAIDMPESIALNQSVVDLSNQVEQIKSLHAIYRNSLLFFPEASRQLHQLLKKNSQANELIEQLHSLERNILLFNISPDSFYQAELEQNILVQYLYPSKQHGAAQAIKNGSVIASLNPETKLHLDILLKHVQIIIDHQQKLDGLLSNILKSPVAEQSHIILALYDADFQASVTRAETIRKGFYISIFLLIIYIILMPGRLKTTITG